MNSSPLIAVPAVVLLLAMNSTAAPDEKRLAPENFGGLGAYKTKVARSLEPGRDHLWLIGAEAMSLLPEKAVVGSRKPVAAPIVDRICRRYLIDLVRVGGNGGPRRKEEVLSRQLTATVETANPGEIRLRLVGAARLETHDVGSGAAKGNPKADDFDLLGYATYDRKLRRFTRFDMVAFSETGHYDEIHQKTVPLGISFELLEGRTPSESVPPSSFKQDYFSP